MWDLPFPHSVHINYGLKMLVKLPSGINFINVKCANFSYECHFSSFFSSYVYVKKAAETTFVQKFIHITLMKLTAALLSFSFEHFKFPRSEFIQLFLWIMMLLAATVLGILDELNLIQMEWPACSPYLMDCLFQLPPFLIWWWHDNLYLGKFHMKYLNASFQSRDKTRRWHLWSQSQS